MLKTGRKGAVCLCGTWGLTSMSVEGITGVSSGSPQRGYYGKTMAEVVLEHQAHPPLSWALGSSSVCSGKAFGVRVCVCSTFCGQRRWKRDSFNKPLTPCPTLEECFTL